MHVGERVKGACVTVGKAVSPTKNPKWEDLLMSRGGELSPGTSACQATEGREVRGKKQLSGSQASSPSSERSPLADFNPGKSRGTMRSPSSSPV